MLLFSLTNPVVVFVNTCEMNCEKIGAGCCRRLGDFTGEVWYKQMQKLLPMSLYPPTCMDVGYMKVARTSLLPFALREINLVWG